MKLRLTLLLSVALIAVSVATVHSQTANDQKITNACFEKLFKDADSFTKTYNYQDFESDRDENLTSHRVDYYDEKLYGYSVINNIPVRKVLEGNNKIYDTDKDFRSYSREFNLDKSFFERFEYRFSRRSLSQGVYILTFSFLPKSNNLPDVHPFDRTINELAGEIDIRERDSALLAFRAHLRQNHREIKYLKIVTVTDVTITFIFNDVGDLSVLKDLRIEIDYKRFIFPSHHTRIMELKGYTKIQQQQVKKDLVIEAEPISKYALADKMWRYRWLIIIAIIALVAMIIYAMIMAYKRIFSKRRKISKF